LERAERCVILNWPPMPRLIEYKDNKKKLKNPCFVTCVNSALCS
jgi:hypothetical protein